MPIKIDKKMESPVFVYYQLDNFYQNHRRYVKSRDYLQLMGDKRELKDIEQNCDPISQNKHLKNMGITKSFNKKRDLPEDGRAIPCGLIAKSYFNDSYSFSDAEKYDNNGNEAYRIRKAAKDAAGKVTYDPEYVIDQTKIAWQSDIDFKFNNTKEVTEKDDKGNTLTWADIQWTDMTNGKWLKIIFMQLFIKPAFFCRQCAEHFIVWMRTAGLPNFRKLWGRIEKDLEVGTYMINIENNYNVAEFSGKKYFVLSTTNMLGGRNYFLAICYIVVGSLCIVFAIVFFAAYMRKKHI